MGRICLIRHGETDWNKCSRLQGRTDIELNITGQKQAEKVGEYLKEYSWNKIISSPLKRAKQTAEIISEIVGIEDVEINEGLIERNYGLAEGLTLEERKEKYPDRNYEGMEVWELLRDRVYSVINKYVSEEDNIILVSHGAAINSILHSLSDGKYGSGITKLHSGCINMLKYSCGKVTVEFYNYKVY